MQFRFNITLRCGESQVQNDYTAHLERTNDDLVREVARLKVAAAESRPPGPFQND